MHDLTLKWPEDEGCADVKNFSTQLMLQCIQKGDSQGLPDTALNMMLIDSLVWTARAYQVEESVDCFQRLTSWSRSNLVCRLSGNVRMQQRNIFTFSPSACATASTQLSF
jgi:hypothetical protein